MPIIFESIVKSDKENGWFIQLRDTQDNRVLTCKDLVEYETKIQELAEPYGGHIDEVKWLQEANLHPSIIDAVRQEMQKFEEKYKDDIEK